MTRRRRQEIHEDPVVAEVRRAGEEMAREADRDLHVLCERLREAERKHPERLLPAPPGPKLRK